MQDENGEVNIICQTGENEDEAVEQEKVSTK